MVTYISSWSDFWRDSESEVRNFKFYLWHTIQPGYICVLVIFQRNLTSTDQDDLYIILIEISRGFWIWTQKFWIPSVASTFDISLLNGFLDIQEWIMLSSEIPPLKSDIRHKTYICVSIHQKSEHFMSNILLLTAQMRQLLYVYQSYYWVWPYEMP